MTDEQCGCAGRPVCLLRLAMRSPFLRGSSPGHNQPGTLATIVAYAQRKSIRPSVTDVARRCPEEELTPSQISNLRVARRIRGNGVSGFHGMLLAPCAAATTTYRTSVTRVSARVIPMFPVYTSIPARFRPRLRNPSVAPESSSGSTTREIGEASSRTQGRGRPVEPNRQMVGPSQPGSTVVRLVCPCQRRTTGTSPARSASLLSPLFSQRGEIRPSSMRPVRADLPSDTKGCSQHRCLPDTVPQEFALIHTKCDPEKPMEWPKPRINELVNYCGTIFTSSPLLNACRRGTMPEGCRSSPSHPPPNRLKNTHPRHLRRIDLHVARV